MTNYVTLFNSQTIDRLSINSEWETVKDAFINNLNLSISCIRSGNALEAPFVRMVAKDGDVNRAFEGFAFCYAKNTKTQKPHSFPNRFIRKNGFLPVNAELADNLEAMMQDEATMAKLLDDLKASWEAKVANGRAGYTKATANVAHFASSAAYEGGVPFKKVA